jgi:hypothetical protein
MDLEGRWTAPWGQNYFWSVNERTFTIKTTAKSGGTRDESFPVGLVLHVARTLIAEELKAKALQLFVGWKGR